MKGKGSDDLDLRIWSIFNCIFSLGAALVETIDSKVIYKYASFINFNMLLFNKCPFNTTSFLAECQQMQHYCTNLLYHPSRQHTIPFHIIY